MRPMRASGFHGVEGDLRCPPWTEAYHPVDEQAVVKFGVAEGPQHDVLRDRLVEGREQQRNPDRGEDPDASAPVAVEGDRRRDQEDDNDPPADVLYHEVAGDLLHVDHLVEGRAHLVATAFHRETLLADRPQEFLVRGKQS